MIERVTHDDPDVDQPAVYAAWLAWRSALHDEPAKLRAARMVSPRTYWLSYAGNRTLREVALRITSLRAGSHGVESLFSAMGNTHSKRRSRLANKTVKMLVFIKVNTRVLATTYDENARFKELVESEDAEDAAEAAEQSEQATLDLSDLSGDSGGSDSEDSDSASEESDEESDMED